VDPEAGTVEILNEDEIDYGEAQAVPCGQERMPVDTTALSGTTFVLRMSHAHVEPMGLGSYLGAVLSTLPIALHLKEAGAEGEELSALVTIGKFKGDSSGVAPPYMSPATDGPCAAAQFALNGSCFTTAPVTLTIDVGETMGFPLPPGWIIRADLEDLSLSGSLADDPAVRQGVLRATLDVGPGVKDLEKIIVDGYCGGQIDGCLPGKAGMPSCPNDPGADFFAQIPQHCDIWIGELGLRLAFSILESIPNHRVELEANFEIFAACQSKTESPGCTDPDLFASAPGGSCPAD